MANFAYPNETIVDIVTLIKYDDMVTGGAFGFVMVLMFFVIAFLALKQFESGQALAAAGFLTMVLTFFLYLMGVVQPKVLWLPVLIMVGGMLYLIFNRTR